MAFYQSPYTLQDKVTYGTKVKLQGIQVVSLSTKAGIDIGDSIEEIAGVFGTTKGYKTNEPSVVAPPSEEDDLDF